MTLTIELPPELERRLREQAEREGLDASRFVEHLVKDRLLMMWPPQTSLWDTLTPEEWKRQTREWVASHKHNGPMLSDEAISRESIYEERVNAILGGHEHSPEVGRPSKSDESPDSAGR